MSGGGFNGYYDSNRGRGQQGQQGASAHLVRYEVKPSLEVIKVVKIEDVDKLTEVIELEVTTAPEVTALTEASTEVTKEVPMIKTVQEEEQEDVGEEGVPMGTSSGEPTRITHTEIIEIT